LFAASQNAGLPALAPPLLPVLAPPGLVAAVLVPGAGVGEGLPLLEQPATSAAVNASATSNTPADVRAVADRVRTAQANRPAR
jgi:hypothetical protein